MDDRYDKIRAAFRNQVAAAFVKCCDAGRVAYPRECPWHGTGDPMYRRLEVGS